MRKIGLVAIGIAFVALGCATPKILKYGYLPGGEYPYYVPGRTINLNNSAMKILVSDRRDSFSRIEISGLETSRDSELEGDFGKSYFENYLNGMIQYCKGQVSGSSDNAYTVDLEVLCPHMSGAGFVTVHGLVQFTVRSNIVNKRYSVDIKDGDPDSPIGRFAFSTRKAAMRKLVAAATRKAIEDFLRDVENSASKQ